MCIAITRTGADGSALARGLHGKGHGLTLRARDPLKAAARARAGGAVPVTAADAGGTVIRALPRTAAQPAARAPGGPAPSRLTEPLFMVRINRAILRGNGRMRAFATVAP